MAGTRIGIAMATALVVLVLGSCARDDSASEVDPGGAASADGSNGATGGGGGGNGSGGSGGSSDPNGPGPDTPVDDPTLSLPGLPIGGNLYSSIDGNHPDNQCTNVNWIVDSAAADLVSGIAVEVTGVAFDPVAFTVASAGCDDDAPPCPGFVFTADARVCNLAVAPIPGSDTEGSFAFALLGRIDCRQIGSERCRDFTEAVAAEPMLWKELDPPVTGSGLDPDGDGGGTDGSTDGGTDGATDGATDGSTDGARTAAPTGAPTAARTGAPTGAPTAAPTRAPASSPPWQTSQVASSSDGSPSAAASSPRPPRSPRCSSTSATSPRGRSTTTSASTSTSSG